MTVTVWKYPKRDEWKSIMARPQMDLIALSRTVSDILESVRCEGDDALRRYEKQFDRVVLDALQVTPAEMEEGIAAVCAGQYPRPAAGQASDAAAGYGAGSFLRLV